MVANVVGPSGLDIDPRVLTTNLLFTLVFVFFFGLTSEIFNSTIDENRDEIEGWITRLTDGPLRILRPLMRADAALDRLAEEGGVVGAGMHALVVLALTGVIYSFLSTDIGFNTQTAILFTSLVVGLGIVTYVNEGGTTLLAVRRHGAPSTVKMYGTAVGVAIACVVASRVINFEPGLIYGFIASSVILAPIALKPRDEALLVIWPALGLLIASLVAWALLQPIHAAATGASASWILGLADAILATVFVGGLEGLFFSLLPIRFMDGAVVMRWSRMIWALLFGLVTFLWWQLLLNRDAAYLDAFKQSSVMVALAMLAFFVLTTGTVWTYFRFHAREEAVEGSGEA